MRKLTAFAFIACLCLFAIFRAEAQQGVVTGKVTNATTGEALPSVSVLVKGTKQGTQSNANGEFSIKVAENVTLLFNSVGYQAQEVAVKGQGVIDVKMVVSSKDLEQVVVIGYGKQKKSDLTGSITMVSAKDISNQASANPAQSLQGKVAGVQVSNLGTPGSQPTIRIRGLGSVSSNVNPLYVVDGVLTSDITFLGNNDIESISILKDASSSAIYGIQAANGVVIITTKRGKNGQPRINYSGYAGIQKPINLVEMASGKEYIALLNEKDKIAAERTGSNFVARDPAKYPASTDWYAEILRKTAFIQSHELSFSGGNEKTQFAIGGGYFEQQGIAKNNDYKRISLRTAVDSRVTKFLKVGVNVNISNFTSNNIPDYLFQSAYVAPPSIAVRNNAGDYADMTEFGSFANPSAKLNYYNNRTQGFRLVGGVYGEVYITRGLTFKSAYGLDGTYSTNRDYVPKYYVSGVQRDTTMKLTKKIEDPLSYYWDNTLTYDFKVAADHKFTVLLGANAQQQRTHSMTGSRLGVTDYGETSWYLGLGSTAGINADESVSLYRAASVFGRLNYAYKQRYMMTATLRRDAASIFPKNNRVDYFPSIGLGWILTEEGFMKDQNIFQYLKLRASWGKMGNSGIPNNVIVNVTGGGNYSTMFGNQIQPGNSVTQLGPTALLWETINETDIGFEGTTLGNKLTFELDYYHKKTNSAIFNVTTFLPMGSSNASYLDNNADVLNQGVELSLKWKDKVGSFSYSVGGYVAYNSNKVTSLNDGTVGIYSGAVNYLKTTYTVPGRAIGSFYGRQVVGIFQNENEVNNYKDKTGKVIQPGALPGDFKYADINNDGQINDKDRTFLGSAIPKYNFGFNLSGEYKNFDLTIDLYAQGGNKIYNAKRFRQLGNENYDRDFYEHRWHGEGTSTIYPSADLSSGANKETSSWFLESGNFFKVRNLQLGYTLPQAIVSKMKINGLRLYVNAANPFNFFRYNGFTPEVSNIDNNKPVNERIDAVSQGIDNNVYPISAVYNFGINLNL